MGQKRSAGAEPQNMENGCGNTPDLFVLLGDALGAATQIRRRLCCFNTFPFGLQGTDPRACKLRT